MRIRSASIRVRLTAWYAATVLLILVSLAGGIYGFVRANLERALDTQLERDFGIVSTVVAASPHGRGDGGHLPGDVLFMVMEAQGERTGYLRLAYGQGSFVNRVLNSVGHRGRLLLPDGSSRRIRLTSTDPTEAPGYLCTFVFRD